MYFIVFQFAVVGAAVVKEFAFAGGLAVADGNAVVAAVETDEHPVVTGNEG